MPADVTLRGQLNSELPDDLCRSIVQDQTEYVIRWLPDGTLTLVNPAYCARRAATAEELIGAHVATCLSREEWEALQRKI